jgi:colicin import membrane protein
MARKLKTYQTSLGFFDLAIAAPSMAAALRAWGSDTNLFQQGFAKETDDPAIVAATLAKPGVVLRRPVGSDGAFSEHAELPKELPVDKVKERTATPRATTREPPARKVDDKAAREAGLGFAADQVAMLGLERSDERMHHLRVFGLARARRIADPLDGLAASRHALAVQAGAGAIDLEALGVARLHLVAELLQRNRHGTFPNLRRTGPG